MSINELKNNIIKNIHKIKLYIMLNKKVQYGLYIVAGLIILIIITAMIMPAIDQDEKVLSYKTKTCYSKRESIQGEPQKINLWKDDKGSTHIIYEFEQICHNKIKVNHEEKENYLDIIINPHNTGNNCICKSDVEIKIDKLPENTAYIRLYHGNKEKRYLVYSFNLTQDIN